MSAPGNADVVAEEGNNKEGGEVNSEDYERVLKIGQIKTIQVDNLAEASARVAESVRTDWGRGAVFVEHHGPLFYPNLVLNDAERVRFLDVLRPIVKRLGTEALGSAVEVPSPKADGETGDPSGDETDHTHDLVVKLSEQLARLMELKARSIITQDDFNVVKHKLIELSVTQDSREQGIAESGTSELL